MPSPIGHALGGALVGIALNPRTTTAGASWCRRVAGEFRTPLTMAAMAAACAPDLDLLWGRHTMETHSLGAAIAAGLVVSLLAPRDRGRVGVAVALAWSSHVLFDWLGSDDTPPLGVMAFWPFSTAFTFADAHVFEAISRRYWRAGFWAHNARAVATEIALLGPPLALLVIFRVRGRRVARQDDVSRSIREEPT